MFRRYDRGQTNTQTNRQTDTLIAILRSPTGGGVMNIRFTFASMASFILTANSAVADELHDAQSVDICERYVSEKHCNNNTYYSAKY